MKGDFTLCGSTRPYSVSVDGGSGETARVDDHVTVHYTGWQYDADAQ